MDWMDGSSRVTRKPVTITKASAVFSPDSSSIRCMVSSTR